MDFRFMPEWGCRSPIWFDDPTGLEYGSDEDNELCLPEELFEQLNQWVRDWESSVDMNDDFRDVWTPEEHETWRRRGRRPLQVVKHHLPEGSKISAPEIERP